jgi:hypothetical protein
VKVQTFSIDYSFSLDPSKAQGALLLDPSLLPVAAGSSGATGFGFWGLDPLTGNLVESLTYDPSRRGGATAYDLNGDNIVDFIELRLGATGLGDLDPSSAKVGGAITASKEAIAPGFFANGSQQLQIVDPSRPNSKGAVYVTATLTGRASTVNEIGFVVVDAGVPITLDLIRQSGNVLFSSLESTNVPDLSGVDLRSKISLRNGQTVRFYETVDSTLADLSRGKRSLAELGSSFRFLDYNTDQASRTARVVSASGISVNLGFSQAVPGLFDLIANRQMEAPVLDFTSNAVSTRAVSVEWSLFREAVFSPVFSLYRVINQEGTVRDPLTGALFNPGDAGYKDASIRGQVGGLSGLTVGDLRATSGRVTLNETTLLAPMALVRTATSEDTFYPFAAANTDGLTHFRRLADNVFGLEDVRGGGDLDYDDHIFAFKPVSLV